MLIWMTTSARTGANLRKVTSRIKQLSIWTQVDLDLLLEGFALIRYMAYRAGRGDAMAIGATNGLLRRFKLIGTGPARCPDRIGGTPWVG